MPETSGEYPIQNDGETLVANGNGLPPYDPTTSYGFDDDDLADAESAEDAAYAVVAAPPAVPVPTITDADMADMQARLQAAEDYNAQREAGRVKKKVHGATTASGFGAVLAALVPMLDGLDLPDGVEDAIMVAIVVLTTFVGGYFTKERPSPPGLSA